MSMSPQKFLISNDDTSSIVSRLATRDAVLWIRKTASDYPDQAELARFVGLPWSMVVCEEYDPKIVDAIQHDEGVDSPLVRRRGFVQVIESDISKMDLPTRSLPLLFLAGSDRRSSGSPFEQTMRRMAMLDHVRTSSISHIVVVGGEDASVPADVTKIWGGAFQPSLTVVSDAVGAQESLKLAAEQHRNLTLVNCSYETFVGRVLQRYMEVFPPDRLMIRVRDRRGSHRVFDLTSCDQPERPVLGDYELIQEGDLASLMPAELSEDAFASFFTDDVASWQPYAAGLPWPRGGVGRKEMRALLHRLDASGPEANAIGFVSSEPGAGGTTLARALAWEAARGGYPVMVAKPVPFHVSALSVVDFLHRAKDAVVDSDSSGDAASDTHSEQDLYETPWLIVFDVMHWQHRATELVSFFQEIKRSGRPALVLVVTDPQLPLQYHNKSIFKQLCSLTHVLSSQDAADLGRHLNAFLTGRGLARTDHQWQAFYNAHSVDGVNDAASFWVALSFWIRGQYDLNESLQSWIFHRFIAGCPSDELKLAVMEIAALSAERVPTPEGLLYRSSSPWPTSALLADARSDLAAVGLVTLNGSGGRHWALIHDILGKYLLNAVFYDPKLLDQLQLPTTKSADHLRLVLLGQIALKSELGEKRYRALGEDFATTFLKIDPDHGHLSFSLFWREALSILNSMPSTLRDSSRVFRHHTAISRRRIAKLGPAANVTVEEKVGLLEQAVTDLRYALEFIDQDEDSESDLNLINSIANAYFDLASAQAESGAARDVINTTRGLGYQAAARAYEISAANPFVIETHVKSLLERATEEPLAAPSLCVEALNALFAAAESKDVQYRRDQLAKMADQALQLLLTHAAPIERDANASVNRGPVQVLVSAWISLASSFEGLTFFDAEPVDFDEIDKALEILADPAGAGNAQVLRLTFDLTVRRDSLNFERQLDLLNQLMFVGYRLPAQLQLDRALLLYQAGKAAQGVEEFKKLRDLWRSTEQYVSVPDRLRWLLTPDRQDRRIVDAVTLPGYGSRAQARIPEFNNSVTPYRPEEHALSASKPGLRFKAYVSFGHNGPFLRPLTSLWSHG